MYLKEITINGFKSFAKKSELEFSSPITAIVGPNGSGKSNVAESFRFVLGEQSVKSLRGKKGEDLIWGGSESSARGNRASVSIVFDNSSRAFVLDYDEITIERIVHRDGQNEYKLNGTAVRLKDIHELLAEAHIGSTGHHIISQGEADRVISASTKERREMIEDALGLKVYQIKKADATRKLNKTEENILQVASLRREAAPHLKYLKKQVERAERSIAVQAELSNVYAEYLKREDLYLAHRYDELITNLGVPRSELEQVTQSIATLKAQLAKVTQVQDTTVRDEADQDLQQVRAERVAAERALSTLEGQISLLERRINQVQQPTAEAPQLIPRAKLQTLVASIKASAEKALNRQDASTVERTLRDVLSQLTQFIEREEVVKVDTSAADQAELHSVQSEVPSAQKTLEQIEQKEEKAIAALTSARQELEQQSNQHHESERTLFTQLGQERELRQTVTTIETELQVIGRDRDDFKRELQEAVALLGRAASDYLSYEIKTEGGELIADDTAVSEERQQQRERRRNLERLKIRLEELGVGATDDLLREYKEAQERDEFLAKETADLESSVENLNSLVTDMDAQLHDQFVVGIEKIATEFNRFFTLMFGGGEAKLERVKLKKNEDDESEQSLTEEGVDLHVALPNKRVKGLQMLSGGERALTSIALIFAMSQVNPPPFIILDETDAALDEANSRRYGDMIQALAQKSQLVLITHNRETMSRAGILYGITMGGDGISKVLSVKFDDAAVNAK
ncbi:MAG: chromosome segregation ATPase [Candidatus Paceibacteria bacterium]|jgi:chromosome segregation protein